MAGAFDFISPTDKPALLALTNVEWLGLANVVTSELGYKVHTVDNHDDFLSRFNQIQYQLVIIEEAFAGTGLEDNYSLFALQRMNMAQRRHAVILVIGQSFQTMNTLQAFQYSVHAVMNPAEIALLGQIVQQIVADNILFLQAFRDIQLRLARGAAEQV